MADIREPKIVPSAGEIAERILFARSLDNQLGRVIFLIGAGCSMTAGIPGAADIARQLVRIVAERFNCCPDPNDHVGCYQRLVETRRFDAQPKGDPAAAATDGSIDWYRVYDEMFRRHFRVPDDVRELFAQLVIDAKGAVNWAHLCLGEMVARRYVATVLTTNFDQLVLSGMVRAGVLPVVCDGIESLNRISGAPSHAQLIELHGSRHTYLLRNRPEDVEAIKRDGEASAAIQKLFQHATTFVAVGYGGREDGVMDLLIRAAEVYPDKELFWVSHSNDPKAISPKVQKFLSTSRNGGQLLGQDADRFFLDLCQSMGIGTPSAIAQPLDAATRMIADVSAASVTDTAIRAEIDRARERVRRLKDFDQQPVDDDGVETKVATIRQLLLAGDAANAYRMANQAMES